MEYESLARRRYREYRMRERKESIKKKIVSFLIHLFMAIVKVLRKAKILRRKVETVQVESG